LDQTPLPLSTTSLPVPVEVVEDSPGHLVLKSRRVAPFCFLTAPPISCFSFALVGVVTVLAGVGVADFMLWRVVVRDPTSALFLALVSLMGAFRIFLLAMIGWATMKWRRGGPIEFDRDGDRVVFGAGCEQPPFPLSAIAAVQLVRTTSRAVAGDIWRAMIADKSKVGYLLVWGAARSKIYQLNLVLSDGSRLNLVNWGSWGEPQRALTQQLAEFLNVPLTGEQPTESG
jgi:hypothetical protein